MRFITKSLTETISLGKMLARGLEKGSVILAYGDLGAGKTAFAKGVAAGLGVRQIVNSPTFNIMKVYQGKDTVFYHIDAYRLEDPSSVSDIGFDEAIGAKDGISLIEWPDYIREWFESCPLVVSVRIAVSPDGSRVIDIKEGKSENE